MEWNLQSTSVVILGAGFSAAATDGFSPLMATYFDQLNRGSLLHDFVGETQGEPAAANVEKVLLALDQIKSAPPVALEGWADKWKKSLPQLRRELDEYTISRLCKSLEHADSENWAVNLLADAGPNTSVISMNYDNIADAVLSNRRGISHCSTGNCPHCKMGALLKRACSCDGHSSELTRRDWQGSLIKPHGSVAWKRCRNPSCCSYECLVADEKCRPFMPCECPYCRDQCGPVMVMPTMSKCLDEFPEIGIMWKAARLAICEAESIVLFGFSMPDSDELLMQMVRKSIHDNRRIKRVVSIDLNPAAVLNRFKRCVPDGLSVEFMPLHVSKGKEPEWFDDLAIPQKSPRFVGC